MPLRERMEDFVLVPENGEKKFDPHQPRDTHGRWSDIPGAGEAVDQIRERYGIPPNQRFEVHIGGGMMQGERRSFADTVDAVVRARQAGEEDVELRVKTNGTTRLPTDNEHRAVLEGAVAVLSRRAQ